VIGLTSLLMLVILPLMLIVAGVSANGASEPTRKLVGGIMLAVGILVMTGSGLCSAAVLFAGGGAMGSASLLVLIVGGLPFVSGFGLFAWGRKLIRAARPPSDEELRRRFD